MTKSTPVRLAYDYLEPDEGCQLEKSPIIFWHGITACKEDWGDIPQKVANHTRRKVYNVDARNHGDSEWTDEFDFFCIADDVLNFLDTIKVQRATLVGHSMGGLAIMRAVAKSTDKIEKIIIEDIGLKKGPPVVFEVVPLFLSLARSAIQDIPAETDERTAAKLIAEFVYKAFPPILQKDLNVENLEQGFRFKRTEDGKLEFKNNFGVLAKAMKQEKDAPAPEMTEKYEIPAHFIYGKQSPFNIEDQVDIIRQVFPNSEFVGIEGATHRVHSDKPAEFTAALLKALQEE